MAASVVFSLGRGLVLPALDPYAFTTGAGEEVDTEGEADPQKTNPHEESGDPDHRLHRYLSDGA